jgi:short subunit fatty acids transporter
MSLASTIWAPASIVHVLVFLTATIAVGVLYMPKRAKTIAEFPKALEAADAAAGEAAPPAASASLASTPAQWLERSPLVLAPVGVMLGIWLYRHFFVKSLSLELNSTITILLLACVLLHRNVARFQHALKEAVALAWPIVLLYHL